MAGDWIKMRDDLEDTPEIIGMAKALGIDEDKVIGLCYRLWRWADHHCFIDEETLDAHANGLAIDWIDHYVRFDGFAQELKTIRWLRAKRSGFILPNAGRWIGENAKKRAVAAQKKRFQRKTCPPNKGTNVPKPRGQKCD